MTDYTERVKALRERSERFYYDGWVDTSVILEQAADAIEELNRIVKEYQKFDGFLAAHGMFEQGPMIPIEPPKEETE